MSTVLARRPGTLENSGAQLATGNIIAAHQSLSSFPVFLPQRGTAQPMQLHGQHRQVQQHQQNQQGFQELLPHQWTSLRQDQRHQLLQRGDTGRNNLPGCPNPGLSGNKRAFAELSRPSSSVAASFDSSMAGVARLPVQSRPHPQLHPLQSQPWPAACYLPCPSLPNVTSAAPPAPALALLPVAAPQVLAPPPRQPHPQRHQPQAQPPLSLLAPTTPPLTDEDAPRECILMLCKALCMSEGTTARLALHIWNRIRGMVRLLVSVRPPAHVRQPGAGSLAAAAARAERVYSVAALWVASKLEERRREVPAAQTLALAACTEAGVLVAAELRVMQWCHWAPYAGFVPDDSHLLIDL